jgi:hypothetical protein
MGAGGGERPEVAVPGPDTITGSAPKEAILKPFSMNSGSLTGPTSTSWAEASAVAGGLRKRRTG